jgi:UDPglucose 6-dehydrogenase
VITVVGLGFVGLTSALGFCQKGFRVVGVDVDAQRVARLRAGEVPFLEPGLEEALTEYLGDRFILVDDLAHALEESDVVFYCIDTPGRGDGSADLAPLKSAIEDTLRHVDRARFRVLVVKSTVPPGTTAGEIRPFIERRGFRVGQEIGLANNPEFLREGCCWKDFTEPDRVVIGAGDDRSGELVKELYLPFGAPIHLVSLNTAEFVKYLSNTFLSTLISFSNEMAMAADALGSIDVSRAFRILHQDHRWSGAPAGMSSYVYPGCGYGGNCLPKDTRAFYMQAGARGYTANVLRDVIEVNDKIKDFVVRKVTQVARPDETIGILGLSFKPGSGDVRETPARSIVERLVARDYRSIIAYDPEAMAMFKATFNLDIQYAESVEELVRRADHLLLLTAWEEFEQKEDLLTSKSLFDFRYMF